MEWDTFQGLLIESLFVVISYSLMLGLRPSDVEESLLVISFYSSTSLESFLSTELSLPDDECSSLIFYKSSFTILYPVLKPKYEGA